MQFKTLITLIALMILALGCRKEKDPDQVRIKSITVTTFPSTNSGSSWDDFGGDPDIYIDVMVGGNLFATFQSVHFSDATNTIQYEFIPGSPILIDNLSSDVGIQLYDYDDLSADDLMTGMTFDLEDQRYTAPLVKTYTTSNFTVELQLEWLTSN
jgi:hypothetical protein